MADKTEFKTLYTKFFFQKIACKISYNLPCKRKDVHSMSIINHDQCLRVPWSCRVSWKVSTRSCSWARQDSPKHVLVGEEIVEKLPPIKKSQDSQIFQSTKRAKTFQTYHKSSLRTQFSLLMPSRCFDWLILSRGKTGECWLKFSCRKAMRTDVRRKR